MVGQKYSMLPLLEQVKYSPTRESLGLSSKDYKPVMSPNEQMARMRAAKNENHVKDQKESHEIDWNKYRSLTSTDIQGHIYEYLTEHGTASAQELSKSIFGFDHPTMVRRVGGILNRNKQNMSLENYEISMPEKGCIRVWRIGKAQPSQTDLRALISLMMKQQDFALDELLVIKQLLMDVRDKK